jgi:hypothetical protein
MAEHAKALLERECRRMLGAEVVRRHRTAERDDPRLGERGQLESREVRVSEPAGPGMGDARIVDAIEQARPAVAAAHRAGDVDLRIDGHPLERGKPLVVRSGEALQPGFDGRVADHAVAEACEPALGAIHRRGVGREAGRRVEAEVHADRRAAKNAESSAPHASPRTPAITSA